MVYCYPVAGKAKSQEICKMFAKGCGGEVVAIAPPRLYEGPAFFYGIDDSNVHLWRQILDDPRREYYYCDNSYFDESRQQYFRVTKNRLQHTGTGTSDLKRFELLGLKIKPQVKKGSHIVVCPQSDSFMEKIVGYRGSWTQHTLEELRMVSKRPIRLRLWSPAKDKLAATLQDDLRDAHALVTWSSAAAITAVLNGVPAFCSKQCAAATVGNRDLGTLEFPYFFGESFIRNWAGVLADNQWTLDEMFKGKCWEDLQK